MPAQDALNAAQCTDHDGRGAGGPAECVGVPQVPICASLQVAVAGGCHLAPPALSINQRSVIREIQAGPIGAMITAVGVWRRCTSPHHNGSRIAIVAIEWVGPSLAFLESYGEGQPGESPAA